MFRGAGRAYLNRDPDAAEARATAVRLVARADLPAGGLELAALRASAGDRDELLRRWVALQDELDDAAFGPWLAARGEAARRSGAPHTVAFLEAEQAQDVWVWLERLRHGAIEPLTPEVEAAVAERSRRAGGEGGDPGRALVAETLVEHEPALARPAVVAALERFRDTLGADPGTEAPHLVLDAPRGAWPAVVAHGATPRVRLGALGGPAALARSLAELGRATRQGFVRSRRGGAGRWSDPAFDFAAGALFRRLALSESFLDATGVAAPRRWLADLRVEESLEPRRLWAYLSLARDWRSVDTGPDARAAAETLERVTARPALPGRTGPSWRADPGSAAALTGLVFALLLEERLMTRFGRGWYARRQARETLRECWEGEADETPHSMAAALDVGTIDATPILECCRPR